MAEIPPELQHWITTNFLNVLPIAVAAVDWESTIVYANRAFEERFGEWRRRKCYEVYRDQQETEQYCRVPQAFKDGLARTSDNVGYDIHGRLTHFTKHTVPVLDANGEVAYLIEMLTDITEMEQIRREYQLLFDQVPCSVLIIDRDYRIVKANRTLQQMLGRLEGGYCFNALKNRDSKCAECTARQTFEDGQQHTGHHLWQMKNGRTVHLHVITVPLRLHDGAFDAVMELAVDITDTMKLQDSLSFAHSFMETIIATAMDGIFAVNQKGKVTLFNPAARKLFGVAENQVVAREELAAMLPKGFLARVSEAPEHVYLPEARVRTLAGEEVPVRLVGTPLKGKGEDLGMAFSAQDQREIKTLEREKLAAERLAAVGQTVAGLAHGIKNLVIALEGGMYMLGTGIQKGDIDRLQKGMDQLSRNIERISAFVKTFLRFARGREIQAHLNDPAELAREAADMYAAKAAESGVELVSEIQSGIRPAAFDYEAMLECLANIVLNGIDACRMMADDRPHHVWIRLREEEGAIVLEVSDDGCGMDEEVKRKVFTTLFTTKGLSGSGLGLLMANKTVQEHGGKIFTQSQSQKGSTFRIILPRLRLPRITES